jgi:hypothetical protein
MTTTYKLTNRFFFAITKYLTILEIKLNETKKKYFFNSHIPTQYLCNKYTRNANENKHTQTRFAPRSQEE